MNQVTTHQTLKPSQLVDRKCNRLECNNIIPAGSKALFCSNSECQRIRKYNHLLNFLDNKKKTDGKYIPPAKKTKPKMNIISKRINPEWLNTGITIHCIAKNSKGRCSNKFKIVYRLPDTENDIPNVFPCFCEIHRNEYKRKRFEENNAK